MVGDAITTLRRGVAFWNAWRKKHPDVVPNLDGAILSGMDLRKADFRGASLRDVYFNYTDLGGADLRNTLLQGADFRDAILYRTKLSGADLRGAHLKRVDLRQATLTGTDLRCAAILDSDLSGATIVSCSVFGITSWGLTTKGLKQKALVVSDVPPRERAAAVTLDELEAAQLVHLLMHGSKVSRLIDAINSKLVLILGRFTPHNKKILDAVRERIRATRDYVPIMFDFARPESQDYMQPVVTLAQLSRFVIADVTQPKIVLEELPRILLAATVPVRPIMRTGSGREPTTLYNLRLQYNHVLDTYFYTSKKELLRNLERAVIRPAEALVKELSIRRRREDPLRARGTRARSRVKRKRPR